MEDATIRSTSFLENRRQQQFVLAGTMLVGSVVSPAFGAGALIGAAARGVALCVGKLGLRLMPTSWNEPSGPTRKIPEWRMKLHNSHILGDVILRLLPAILFQGFVQPTCASLLVSASLATPASAILISIVAIAILGALVQMRADPVLYDRVSRVRSDKILGFLSLSIRNLAAGCMMAYSGPAAVIGSALGGIAFAEVYSEALKRIFPTLR